MTTSETFASLTERLPRSWLELAVAARRRSRLFQRGTEWLVGLLRYHDGLVRGGLAAGLRFNTGRSNASYLLAEMGEPDVAQALADVLAPGMTFYDIGANFGLFSLAVARIVGPSGAVVSFEPLPENCRLVEHNAGLNNFRNIRCLRTALGAKDEEGRFLVSADPSWGALAAGERRPNDCTGEITVHIRRLDSLVVQEPIPPPDVVKIDIEGGEVAALAGADNLLATRRPILVIELHETAEAVAAVLARRDYTSSLFGSRVPMDGASGNLHAVAIPSEREDCRELLERFRDPRFPRCERCQAVSERLGSRIA
jgi:FkbM family methyltransferase